MVILLFLKALSEIIYVAVATLYLAVKKNSFSLLLLILLFADRGCRSGKLTG
jgi:hypothetical protein